MLRREEREEEGEEGGGGGGGGGGERGYRGNMYGCVACIVVNVEQEDILTVVLKLSHAHSSLPSYLQHS